MPVDIAISAVVPTYNRQHLISRAVQSILQQTFPPVEVIVVDDGSSDNTRAEVERLGGKVRYVYQQNSGVASARHHGFVVASAPWVALLDSDDVWNPDHLERVVAAIKATSGAAGMYFGNTERRYEGKFQWDLANLIVKDEYELTNDASDWVMRNRQPMMVQSTVFNRTAYFAAGGFLSAAVPRDDTHFFLKLGFSYPACAVNVISSYMTDDDAGNRLFNNPVRDRRRVTSLVVMYKDLYYSRLRVSPAHRKELQRRLADSYRSVARVDWRAKHPLRAVLSFGMSLQTYPDQIWQIAKKGISRLLGRST